MVGRREEGWNVFSTITDPVIFQLGYLVCCKMHGIVADETKARRR